MATLDLPRLSRGLTDSSLDESVSILHSKRDNPLPPTLSLDRQITSGIVIDRKEFDSSIRRGQLILRDGEHDDRTIFTYTVEKEVEGDAKEVTYRWIRTPKLKQMGLQLMEEEHMYRGDMKERRKHGFGHYSVIRRFTDNSETTQVVKGEWREDLFIQGVVEDGEGQQRKIKGSMVSLRSKRETPFAVSNRTIHLQTQRIEKKKTQLFEHLKNSSSLLPPNSPN